jgi:mRNA interferase RelE/StbE
MAKYKIEVKKSAVKEIRRLPQKTLTHVLTIIQRLADQPRPRGCQKLSQQERYRIRYKHYRILYEIFDRRLVIVVVKVARRKEACRKKE